MMDVKQALLDSRFREKLPESFTPDVQKFLSNPGCGCNHPIYKKIMNEAKDQLMEYFPLKTEVEEISEKQIQNNWTVINCTIQELQKKLRDLPPGQKQIEIARYQDEVTVVINELDSNLS